jgi:hypothetical protein
MYTGNCVQYISGNMENIHNFDREKHTGRDNLGCLNACLRIILKRVLSKELMDV